MDSSVELDDMPEPIIQHILSFLTAKEAAQTTLLSNSWRSAWLTQPNLAFERGSSDYYTKILELARKTIQRYEEANIKIQSLTLSVDHVWRNDVVVLNELIAKSLFLGATHLNLSLSRDFVLPHEIVFGSEKLVGLSVGSCTIEIGSSDGKVIKCFGLESLSLSSTHISLDTLSNILSSCPYIQKLSLYNTFGFEEPDGVRSIGDYNLTTVNNHHSLTCLELLDVDFDISSFLYRFPNLKDLTLYKLYINMDTSSQGEGMQISSLSLERLNFTVDKASSRYGLPRKKFRFEFDVPSIRRFSYKSSTGVIAPLSFKSTSREWESRVSITHHKIKLDILWFRKLNKFLTKLRRSKIHLSLDVTGWTSFHYEAGDIRGLCRRRPQVENLTLDVGGLPTLSCYAFFDGLFLLCRPKFITQYLHHGKAKNEYFLCRRLVERVGNEKLSFESHFMYHGLLDLEEVKVAIFDKAVGVWRDVQLMDSLLDAAPDEDDELKVRFQFKWKC